MATSANFVGVIPYSLYENEPVALICKHNYTSTETRADESLYSELVIKKTEPEETCPEAISRVLSKLSNGTFIKLKNKNNNTNDNIKQCYNRMLSSINKFKNVAILENNNGYRLYLIPVKFMKTKKLHNNIKQNVYYKECHWISFNKLLSVIYEKDIQKMIVNNIQNYKHKKDKITKFTAYKPCRLSLQFGSILRNAHFRVIIPLFQELKFTLDNNICKPDIQQIDKYESVENISDSDNNSDAKTESFIVRCKKCRVKLFNDLLVSVHSLNTLNDDCKNNCIFLDSDNDKVFDLVHKMGNTNEIKGLLSCFKCGQKVGRFSYFGQECPCTYQICPAFQVSASKVDIHEIINEYKEEKKQDNCMDIHLPKTQFMEQDYYEILNGMGARLDVYNCIHIVHISDTHELYAKFNDEIPFKKDAINILIHSGDFSPEDGPIKRKRNGSKGMIPKIKQFAQWFKALPHQKKIIIAGNHEHALIGLTKEEIQTDIFGNDDSVIYLQDDMINLYGINIYGTPWNEREYMAFGADNDGMKEKWKLIPDDTDILITHQPPYNEEILCKVTSGGNQDLWNEVVNRIKPKVHLFGHFHAYNGYVKCNDVLFINSSLKPPTERETPCIPHEFEVIFDS